MSPHSGSSRHHSHASRSNAENFEQYVEQLKTVVSSLNEMISSRPHEWEAYLPSARSAITALDQLHFFRDSARFSEQVWFLHSLQDYAFHDADNGCIRDVAEWCQAGWLKVLRNYPENTECLGGLGYNWLQRAQSTLAKIQVEEGTDSSSGGSALTADTRRQSPLYIEAQGLLQPAVDFYTRAVRAGDALGTTTGDLLALTAESQMSLGNVTLSPNDEPFFVLAIHNLRRAAALPGYTLSVYLQQYLNDYGRYVS